MSTDLSAIQTFRFTAMHNLASVHDVDMVTNFPTEIEILLHQKNRDAPVTQSLKCSANVLDD